MEQQPDSPWAAATPPPFPPAARPVPVMPLGGYPDGIPPTARPSAPPPPVAAVGSITASVVTVPPRRRAAAALALAGAMALAFGTFMPWATADVISSGLVRGNGWQDVLGRTPWGPVMLLVAVVVAFAVGGPLLGADAPGLGRLGVGASVAGVMAVVFQFVELLRPRPGVEIDLELGPFVMLSGSLLALIGAALAARTTRPAIVAAPRAVGAVG